MNWKKLIIASIAVFVCFQAMDYVIHNLILKTTYESMGYLWRTDMARKAWMFFPLGLVISFLFLYIFAKGYENKGCIEGLRYGLIVGLFMNIPSAFGTYVVFPIPYTLALKWFGFGMVEFLVCGIVAAAIYKPRTA